MKRVVGYVVSGSGDL